MESASWAQAYTGNFRQAESCQEGCSLLRLPEEILSPRWRILAKRGSSLLPYDVVEKNMFTKSKDSNKSGDHVANNMPCAYDACTMNDDPHHPSIIREAEETFFRQLESSSQALRCCQRLYRDIGNVIYNENVISVNTANSCHYSILGQGGANHIGHFLLEIEAAYDKPLSLPPHLGPPKKVDWYQIASRFTHFKICVWFENGHGYGFGKYPTASRIATLVHDKKVIVENPKPPEDRDGGEFYLWAHWTQVWRCEQVISKATNPALVGTLSKFKKRIESKDSVALLDKEAKIVKRALSFSRLPAELELPRHWDDPYMWSALELYNIEDFGRLERKWLILSLAMEFITPEPELITGRDSEGNMTFELTYRVGAPRATHEVRVREFLAGLQDLNADFYQ